MADSTEPANQATERNEPAQHRGSRLISASAVMAAGTGMSRLLGFAKASLIVAALGSGTRQADMFNTAQVIPQALYMLLAGGVLNTVFVPQIVRAMKTEADGGEAYTNRLLTLGLSAIGLITVGATVLAPVIIGDVYLSGKWKAPELAGQYNSVIMLSYLCLPQIFFYGVHVMVGQVLNARGKFGPMMWSPIGNNIVAIASILLFMVVWHGQSDTGAPFSATQILVLGVGTTLGIATQGLLLLPFLRGIGFRFRPRFDIRNSGLGRAAQVAKWTVGYMIVTQLGLVVITRLANGATAGHDHGAGWTVYQYANLVFMLPHSVITVSLVTAMLPSVSASVVAGELSAARREITQTMRLAVTALLPAAVAFIALAFPIAQVLFGHGAGADQWRPIGWSLMAFAIGLVPFTLQHVCVRAFYALENTRVTFLVQILIVVVNVSAALVFALILATPRWVAPALAIAHAASYVVGFGASFRRLGRELPGLSPGELAGHCLRVFLAVLPAAIVAYLVTVAVGWWSVAVPARLLALIIAAGFAIPIYIGTGKLLRIQEINQMARMLARRLGRGNKSSSSDQQAAEASPNTPEPRSEEASEAPGPTTAAAGAVEAESTHLGGSLPTADPESGSISSNMTVGDPIPGVPTPDAGDETSVVTQIRRHHLDFPAGQQRMTDDQADPESGPDGPQADPSTTGQSDPSDRATQMNDPSQDPLGSTRPTGNTPTENTPRVSGPEDNEPNRAAEAAGAEAAGAEGPDAQEDDASPVDPTSPEDDSAGDTDEPDHLPAGTVLADRYRLEELLATVNTSVTWRGFDQVLSRSVLIHLLPAGHERGPDLLAAGRRAARATDSRFLRVLDAIEEGGTDPDGRPIGPYVVCEYAVGQTLRTVLSVAPLTGLESAWVIREIAEALAGTHDQGLHHGRLNPDTVIITPSGNIKIVGLLIEAALAETAPNDSSETGTETRTETSAPASATEVDLDIDSLGRLLYACLVARWPGDTAFGLPAAPTASSAVTHNGHRWLTPRQVRHGVSPALDRICDQLLSPQLRQQPDRISGAAVLVGELDRVLGPADATGDLERRLRHPQPTWLADDSVQSNIEVAESPAPATQPPPAEPIAAGGEPTPSAAQDAPLQAQPVTYAAGTTARSHRKRRWVSGLIIALVLLALIAVVLLVRQLDGRQTGSQRPASTHSATSNNKLRSKRLKITNARDFDPQGDKTENPKEVKYAYDGDRKTRWRTVSYYGSPKFGNLKKGLGLVLDLGHPKRARKVKLWLSGDGTDVQARVPKGNAAKVNSPKMGGAKAWRKVAKTKGAGSKATLTFDKAVKTRFVLVYLTSLPKEGGDYRGGIYEVQVHS